MPFYNDYRALFADGNRAWHAGDAVIRYDYITTQVPEYYDSIAGYQVNGVRFDAASDLSMDPRQRAMMEQAVARWDEVATLNLEQGGGQEADIVIGSADFNNNGLLGFAYYPEAADLGLFPGLAGDVWINRGSSYQYTPGVGPILGHSSWHTYIHELGHALGLSHPNDAPNDPDSSVKYSVMSYVEHPTQAGLSYDDGGWPLTPMVWDIQAIQDLYGVNTETRSTGTVYVGDGGRFDPGAERAFQYGASDMQVVGADGQERDAIFTIWDAGGTDLLDASDFDEDAVIDLRPGAFSSLAGVRDNLAMAAAVQQGGAVINYVENAWGGAGDDLIHGNGARNALRGHSGDDRIDGRGGDDLIRGGRGNDVLRGQQGDDRSWGQQGQDRLLGQRGDDHLRGGGQRDTLIGGAGADTLDGGAGHDILRGGAGADVFVFRPGTDRVRDFNATAGDRVDLRHSSITDYADLQDGHLRAARQGLWIEDDRGHRLLLEGVSATDLGADDFLF